MRTILSLFRGWGVVGYIALALLLGAVALEAISWT
jgi:hypothetical protein